MSIIKLTKRAKG